MYNGFKKSSEYHDHYVDMVSKLFEAQGWIVDTPTYHDRMKSESVKRLKKLDEFTSLWWRGHVDRIAIGRNSVINFEVKARDTTKAIEVDTLFEAVPFLYHLREAEMKVKIFYFCCNANKKQEFVFRVNDKIQIESLQLTDRCSNELVDFVVKWTKNLLPSVEILQPRYNGINGSNDPYFIMNWSQTLKFDNWKTKIEKLTELDKSKILV